MLARTALRLALCAATAAALAAPASATVISAASDAFDVTLTVQVPGLGINTNLGPVSQVAGTAPPPYDLSDALVDQAWSSGGLTISKTTLFAEASSDVDGAAGSRTTDAEGGIDQTSIMFDAGPFTLLDLDLTALVGRASVTGDFGSLAASGDADILSVDLTIDALPTWSWNLLDPAPNTLAVDTGLVTVVLNEQVEDCSGPAGGTDTCSISVNALHATVSGSLHGFTVFADLVVGHAAASMTAVPEPGVGLLLGLAVLVAARRVRR